MDIIGMRINDATFIEGNGTQIIAPCIQPLFIFSAQHNVGNPLGTIGQRNLQPAVTADITIRLCRFIIFNQADTGTIPIGIFTRKADADSSFFASRLP